MARQMKDSGIEWIGEIPAHYKKCRIKNIAELHGRIGFRGYTTDDLVGVGEGSITLSPSNIKDMAMNYDKCSYITWEKYDESPEIQVHDGDILMVKTGSSYGKTAMVTALPMEATINPQLIVMSGFKVEPRFLNYYFHTEIILSQVENAVVGGTIPTMAQEKINNFFLFAPPIDEQRLIADFLDRKCAEIDAVIERTKATIEEYKKLKQAVITEAVTKGVRGPRPVKDSGIEWLGCLPNEWDCTKLKQVWISVDSGVSVNAADYPTENDSQYGVLKTSCVSKFVFLPNEHKQVDADEYARVACPVKKDTIIVSRMNTPDLVGACGYVDADYPNLFLPDRLWQISFDPDVMAKYVWYYLNNQMVRAYISSLSTGTSSSMQNISKPQFGGITIAIPSIEEQLEITAYLDERCAALDTLINKKTALLTELETYKKSLIYEYVTGKKEVM